ncbi:MAG: SUMF1/EgtB/PvdO family nonheme iron enzyme [Minwuia sp.]|nr:SUMF1/EgtB/PvdO family nonheme iron enzyme [Minwuia sp.]
MGKIAASILALLLLGLAVQVAHAGSPSPAPATLRIPAGPVIVGSDRGEREMAYALDEAAYGHSVTRDQRWYENEPERKRLNTPSYRIMRDPVTNADYARFIQATGHAVPDVDPATWESYGLIHPYARTRRHAWADGAPPAGRDAHPVVLVSRHDADAYATWLSAVTGAVWRVPTELEWEKAARGIDGVAFPWGETFDPAKLNSHDQGPFDTRPVGAYVSGQSPFGMRDPAGQVFEWTATPSADGRSIVKGGSWDDSGCGVCRPAARHGRPDDLKHILVGFRLVQEQAQ